MTRGVDRWAHRRSISPLQERTSTEKDHSALILYALITRSAIVSLSRCPSIDTLVISSRRMIMSHVMDMHFHHCPISRRCRLCSVDDCCITAFLRYLYRYAISYSLSFRFMIIVHRPLSGRCISIRVKSDSSPARPFPDRQLTRVHPRRWAHSLLLHQCHDVNARSLAPSLSTSSWDSAL